MVQPGPESLTPNPEPVAKPQLPEGYVSPLLPSPLISLPSAKPDHRQRIPHFLTMSGILPGSQVPMLGFFLLAFFPVFPPLGVEHPVSDWPRTVPLGVLPHISRCQLLPCLTTFAHQHGLTDPGMSQLHPLPLPLVFPGSLAGSFWHHPIPRPSCNLPPHAP